MVPLLLTAWATGALVFAACFWLDSDVDLSLTSEVLLFIVSAVLWPLLLTGCVFGKLRKSGLLAVALLLVPALAQAQTPNFGGEERTESLTYKGVRANAQTKPENHTRNRNPNIPGWGGCVPSSVRTAALHAGIPRDQIDHFWEIAQREVGVGGTDPQMLASMLRRAFPDEKWVSYVGSDPAEVRRVYDELSAKGYLVCSTMAWGAPELYGNRRIAHMVSDPHFSTKDDLACVEDNNDPPGVYRWMPSSERLKRALGGGQAWLFAFTRLPPAVQGSAVVVLLLIAAALFFFAASLVLAGWRFLFS